jgi:single-stranded-DNA-specific exonuclease
MFKPTFRTFPFYDWWYNPDTISFDNTHDLLKAIFTSRSLFENKPEYHSPYLMSGIKPSVERIIKALSNGEKILVHGDYDVDGIVGAVLLFKFLTSQGGNALIFLPQRQVHGYGLAYEAIEKSENNGISLIVTVDCGIGDRVNVEKARQKGIDIIVTDHHEIPAKLPDAYAIVHQAIPGENYPYHSLSGAAVAWKLIQALSDEMKIEIDQSALIPYIALATVSDVMPLTGENWLIVRDGIKAIRTGHAPHIELLSRFAGVSLEKIGSRELGVHIGSRLNAPGRLKSPVLSAKFLLEDNKSKMKELAQKIENMNHKRRDIQSKVGEMAFKVAERESGCPIHVLYDPAWHEGVLGTAASHVVERTGNPTILFTKGDNGSCKGSARSPESIDIFKLLCGCSGLLDHFGGHKAACGLSIEEPKLNDFRENLIKCVKTAYPDGFPKPRLEISSRIGSDNLDLKFAEELNALEPFGKDNGRPVFEFSPAIIQNANFVGGGQHLKIDLVAGKKPVKAIFFKTGGIKLGDIIGRRISVAASPFINEYNGKRNLEYEILDLKFIE